MEESHPDIIGLPGMLGLCILGKSKRWEYGMGILVKENHRAHHLCCICILANKGMCQFLRLCLVCGPCQLLCNIEYLKVVYGPHLGIMVRPQYNFSTLVSWFNDNVVPLF